VAQKSGEPSWRYRRILIYGTVVLCFVLLYFLIGAADTRVNDTLAWSICVIIVLLVMTYTGAATFQDVAAIWTMRSARPYADPPTEPVPPAPPAEPAIVADTVVVNEQKP
jgi:hypothetical protein